MDFEGILLKYYVLLHSDEILQDYEPSVFTEEIFMLPVEVCAIKFVTQFSVFRCTVYYLLNFVFVPLLTLYIQER